MRIEAITIYKSQKAAGVSLPSPRPKILKISRVYNVQCTSKNYDCEKNGNDDRRNEPGGHDANPAEFYDQVAAATRLYGGKPGHVAQLLKKYALSTEDVCIKLLTVAENAPALARLVWSKSSNHSSPLTHSSQSRHGFSGTPRHCPGAFASHERPGRLYQS